MTENKTQLGLSAFAVVAEETAGLASITVTRFFTPKIEAGGSISLFFDDDGVSDGFLLGTFAYNFVGQSMTVPFLFGLAGASVGDENGFAFGGGGGIRHFVSEDVAILGRVWTAAATVDGDLEFLEGAIIEAGISLYLGS